MSRHPRKNENLSGNSKISMVPRDAERAVLSSRSGRPRNLSGDESDDYPANVMSRHMKPAATNKAKAVHKNAFADS